jgi:hypothetical protein
MKFPWSFKKEVEVKEAPGSSTQINKNNMKNFIVKAIGFIASQGAARGEFSPAEYDLSEIKAASEADSYIKMALMKYSYLVYKAGYDLKGDNDQSIEYLKLRFRMMSFSTGKPMDVLFQELADDLVHYSNAFLVKSRVDKLAPGINAKGVFQDKPIGGYFRVDPASMQIKRDKNGTIKSYQQGNGTDQKTFQPTEVIHIYMDKDANNAFGTPRIVAALEDVKLLRKIEGNVISLIYRFAIPIYQWTVGLAESGFQATDQEIKEAQAEIEKMPLDGVIVTNERTKITAIGAEGEALDASKYLAYFEKRVFTALGVSESQMGRGGAKQDADSMEEQVHNTVKHIQKVLSVFIENYVLNELLLEGGFNPIMNEQDIVRYEFNEISLDTNIKKENHEMLKYQSNMITSDEMRRNMGKKPLSDQDKEQLYMNYIELPAALAQIDEKAKAATGISNGNPGSSGAAGNGKTQSTKPNGAAKNNNTPTNQHGTTSAKIKESDDGIDSIDVNESLETQEVSKKVRKHKKSFAAVYKKYENLRNDISDTDADIDMLISVTKGAMMSDIKNYIQMSSYEGITKAVNDIGTQSTSHFLLPNLKIDLSLFEDEASETLQGLFKDIKKRLKAADKDKTVTQAIFNALEYRIRFMIEFILPKVYWYSYVKTGAHFDIDKAYIQFDGSDDANQHQSEIDTHRFSIDEIPAYHSFCNCKVSFKAGDKK